MEIKDESKRIVVELYQHQVQESIDKIKSLNEKLSSSLKEYIKNLEENIIMAPYNLGYLIQPSDKEKKKKK